MTPIQNTFSVFFKLFVAIIKFVYYNVKDILKTVNILTIKEYFYICISSYF